MPQDKIKEWHSRMDCVTKALKEIDASVFNKKVNRETWSVGQVVDHLIRINRSYYATFDAVKSGAYTVHIHGKVGFLNRAVGKVILNSVEPTRKRKIRTFPIWQPATKLLPIELLDTFAKEQEEMKTWMEQMANISKLEQPVASPANKLIIYPLAAAFEIIVTHEERHLEQINEILSLLKQWE